MPRHAWCANKTNLSKGRKQACCSLFCNRQALGLSFHGFPWGFPKVEGMDAVMVVVDRLSKYAVFIAVPSSYPADMAAKLFFTHVVKIFGLPEDIISDRDPRFTGRFWIALFNMMGSELKYSISYHP
ncbi:hypothetical protein SLA2020_264430 [Shorea laevis]